MFTKDELIKLKKDLLIGKICFECMVKPSKEKCEKCSSGCWRMINRINEELAKL